MFLGAAQYALAMSRNTPLRNRVKELRERLNIRQSELSREAGVTRQTIIAIEKGRLNPSILICLKIAKMLREPVDYIFYLQPGFDYEQEARENANRPKRGRKKRTPAAPAVEPVSAAVAPDPVPDGGAVVADASPIVEVPAAADATERGPSEPVEVSGEQETPAKPEGKDGQNGEGQDPSQAIWDFF